MAKNKEEKKPTSCACSSRRRSPTRRIPIPMKREAWRSTASRWRSPWALTPPSSSRPLSRAARANSITSSTCRSRRILTSKKAAKAVGEKSIEMIHQKELLPLTGYVHGGCSPVGMKKLFPTVFHETAENLETMIVSAGKIGYQVELAPRDLAALVRAKFADIIVE